MNFNITLPPRSCFGRLAETLAYGLARAGHYSQVTDYLTTDSSCVSVLFAAHLTNFDVVPSSTVIYNFEQIGAFPAPKGFYQLAQRCHLWDYSSVNCQRWREMGAEPTRVEVGYVPEMTRIEPAKEEDVDLLFYGLMNDRRLRVLQQLAQCGLKMKVITRGLWGKELDAMIARAKLVLNMHYYDTCLFEIARVSYLLANARCVVTEDSADDVDYGYLDGGVARASYGGLVDLCLDLVHNPDRRSAVARLGFEKFSARKEEYVVRQVVGPGKAEAAIA